MFWWANNRTLSAFGGQIQKITARWRSLRWAALFLQLAVDDGVYDVVDGCPIAELLNDPFPFAAALAEIEVSAEDDLIGEPIVAFHAKKAVSAKLSHDGPPLAAAWRPEYVPIPVPWLQGQVQ